MEIDPKYTLFETSDGAKAISIAGKGRLTCGLCGRTINPDAETEEDPDYYGEEYTYELEIGKLLVIDCCFPKIEQLFLYLASMPNAMAWLREQFSERADEIREQFATEEENRKMAHLIQRIIGD